MFFGGCDNYGGYGYGNNCHNTFGFAGNSTAWGGYGGYNTGYNTGYGGGYGGHHHGYHHYRRNSGNFLSNLFGGYGCNRVYHRRRSSSDFKFFGHGGLFGGGCRYRGLDGEGGDGAGADRDLLAGAEEVDIFASYKGEVKPIAPYAFPNEYTGGKVKGLFIGIGYAGQPSALKSSCADVGVILDTLKHIQFPLKEAAILVDDPKFKGASGLPTRENIIQHMLWLVKDAKAGDVLFFHYSGHAGATKSLSDDDPTSATLVPSDFETAGMIADDDIFEILVRSLPEGVRMTIVMDCAEGSGMIDLPFAYVPALAGAEPPKLGLKMMAEKTYLKHQAKADVVMLCGVGGTNDGSGACTNSLAVAFRETAGLDYIGLLDAMKGTLDKHAIKQIPRLSSSKPMNLRSPFSLFGAVTADDYYPEGSVVEAIKWNGPIPRVRGGAQPASPPSSQPHNGAVFVYGSGAANVEGSARYGDGFGAIPANADQSNANAHGNNDSGFYPQNFSIPGGFVAFPNDGADRGTGTEPQVAHDFQY